MEDGRCDRYEDGLFVEDVHMKIQKGYSTKKDGSMYLSADGFSVENLQNRKRFFVSRRLNEYNSIASNPVHGTAIAVVDHASPGFVRATDALITKEPNLMLTLTGADCFPVYFEDAHAGIVGLAHCGWRGIVGGIVPKMVRAFCELGAREDHIFVTIGPGICKHHFEIQEKDAHLFANTPEAILRNDGIHINLKKIIRQQLQSQEIPRRHSRDAKECTYCLSEKYFSYRRDKPTSLETQLAYIVRRS